MNRRTGILLAVLAGWPLTASAEPLLSFGPDIPLFLTADATVRRDSNILLAAQDKVADTIFLLVPGADLHFTGGESKGGITASEQFIRYSKNTNLNSHLASLAGNLSFTGGSSYLTLASSYVELDQSNLAANSSDQTVRHNLTDFAATGGFELWTKGKLGIGSTYVRTAYPEVGFVDSDVWSLPVDYYYAATSKVDLSLGYAYTRTTLSNGSGDSKDHFFNVGARGDFTPKLNGQIRVGVTERRFDQGTSDRLLGVEANLSYVYSPKTSFGLVVSNDFSNSAGGASQKVFSAGLTGHFELSPAWTAGLGATLDSTNYMTIPNRKDNFLVGTIDLVYTLTTNSAIQFSYIYRKNSSNLEAVAFDDNVASLSASTRF